MPKSALFFDLSTEHATSLGHCGRKDRGQTSVAPINHQHLSRYTGGDAALEIEIMEILLAIYGGDDSEK